MREARIGQEWGAWCGGPVGDGGGGQGQARKFVSFLWTRNSAGPESAHVPWGKEQSPDKKCKQILLPKLWTALMQDTSSR